MRQQNKRYCQTKTKVRSGAHASLPVEGYIVHPSVLNSSIEVAGTLLPFEETEIHPEVAGKVVMLSIKEGLM